MRKIQLSNEIIEEDETSDPEEMTTPIEKKPYHCPICKKPYVKPKWLRKHFAKLEHNGTLLFVNGKAKRGRTKHLDEFFKTPKSKLNTIMTENNQTVITNKNKTKIGKTKTLNEFF